jgi:hypothetical protein
VTHKNAILQVDLIIQLLYIHSEVKPREAVSLGISHLMLNTHNEITFIEMQVSSFAMITTVYVSRDSVVRIATGYGLDDRGRCSSPGRVKNFLLSTSSRPALGSTQPPIQWVPGALSPG